MKDNNIWLESDEKISLVFQSSPRVHISNLIWYIITFLILSAILDFFLSLYYINWNESFSLIVFFSIILISEMIRRNTNYYITDKRIIKKVDFKFSKYLKSFYFDDFSEIYVYSGFGFLFGYENLNMNRVGFINNFFNHVAIRGIDNHTIEKIFNVLEDVLVKKAR